MSVLLKARTSLGLLCAGQFAVHRFRKLPERSLHRLAETMKMIVRFAHTRDCIIGQRVNQSRVHAPEYDSPLTDLEKESFAARVADLALAFCLRETGVI